MTEVRVRLEKILSCGLNFCCSLRFNHLSLFLHQEAAQLMPFSNSFSKCTDSKQIRATEPQIFYEGINRVTFRSPAVTTPGALNGDKM